MAPNIEKQRSNTPQSIRLDLQSNLSNEQIMSLYMTGELGAGPALTCVVTIYVFWRPQGDRFQPVQLGQVISVVQPEHAGANP